MNVNLSNSIAGEPMTSEPLHLSWPRVGLLSGSGTAAGALAGALLLMTACGDDSSATTDASASASTSTTGTTGDPSTTDEGTTTGSTTDPTATATATTSTTSTTGETTGTTGEPVEYGGNILIPELIQGNSFELVMDEGTHTFTEGGSASTTAGYNGGLLGPTMEWVKGETISISLTNMLAKESTTHWHGAHVSPANDGGPHQMIAAGGGNWSPSFEVMNAAATMWYHPHLHEETANQVYSGLSGFIIVRDDVEAALDLPREYGIDDLPLVLQDKELDGSGVLQVGPPRGNTMTVNGAAEAYREVPAQMVRLRLLNGSLEMAYHLEFDDGRTFDVIGNDLGLLEAPASVTSVEIAPGERYEIVVDLSGDEGSSVTLRGLNTKLPMGVLGGTPMMMGMGIEGTDFDVIRLDVLAPTASGTTSLPGSLVAQAIPPEAGATQRSIVMAAAVLPEMGFTLNGEKMDMNVINEYVEEDAVEIWTIENTTPIAHPFHIHDIHYYVLDIDPDGDGPMPAAAPEAWQAGPKDTMLIPAGGVVRFIGEFTDFANDPQDGIADAAYMYHCHILPHEDGGMMGQFAVCPAGDPNCLP
ncbi:MAG: multicopper oxidase domain-containing protein [Myxococcales bacterium]|nr:multicopper oxidase domain-containing protein [Myxococcales bacterium]